MIECAVAVSLCALAKYAGYAHTPVKNKMKNVQFTMSYLLSYTNSTLL